MENKEAIALLDKYLAGECTAEERLLVERAYNLASPEDDGELTAENYLERKARIWNNLQTEPLPVTTYKLWPRMVSAAAAVAAIIFGIWFFNGRYQDTGIQSGSIASVNVIRPGKNGATITLGNSRVIQLNGTKSGVIVGDNLKYNDGTALFADLTLGSLSEAERGVMLTASTARGQTYQFTLPDGTKVWLNAASSMKFPSSFANASQRRVELSGEAYFEVFKNKAQAFVVTSKDQEVMVLGTHFNVNAYDDEAAVKTTLLEGSVRVSSSPAEVVLKPGQQARLANHAIKVASVNPDEAIAWKNGDFMFNNEPLSSIMKKIARWYDVEIVYKDPFMSKKVFGGTINKFSNVSDVLEMLELTKDVHFKIEGRRIVVTK